MEHDNRPDPDALLRRVMAEEARASRAILKLFFGYAPGVGKTFAMLESARLLKEQGIDVVVGCVETHGRRETADLLEGLEILPRRSIYYKGTTLEEFDIERALARKPAVLLMDELAHTNAPGSRHTKRWQDVLELLEAGIQVYTTLNVQHIESLNDVISQITYVRIRETVPDSILDRADEIELIDLSPDELIVRLRDGKVYIPEQARNAIEHFFKRGNLLALRELTLRRTAERLDVDVCAYRRDHDIRSTWPAAERILVCVGPSPSSAKIIRGARRMAVGLRAQWVAVYVDAPDTYPMTPEDRDRLQAHLRLAESLGGDVARLSGHRVADELLNYARDHNITRIVIGKPTHSRWRDRFKGSLVNQLVRGSGDIEVHFIAGDTVNIPRFERTQRSQMKRDWRSYAIAAVLVLLATGAGIFMRSFMSQADFVMIYLLIIMVIAFRYGRGPSIAAAALSVGAYDLSFVQPYYTFSVEHTRHLLTFVMMFVIGIVISSLTTKLRLQEREARQRESRTAALYSLSRELTSVRDEREAAEVTAMHAAEIFGGETVVFLSDGANPLIQKGASSPDIGLSEEELAVARWVADHGRPAGKWTDTLPGSRISCVPIQTGSTVIGAFGVIAPVLNLLEIEHRTFLDGFIRQAALVIERLRLVEETKISAVRIRTEEMRSTLLSAVSHDLRTPLGAITGAGTALRDDRGRLAPEQRAELLDAICTEADHMERLISNILDMVRLESGNLAIRREWIPLEETIGAALSRLEAMLGTRDVKINLPDGLPMLSVDPVLFEQLFVNLFENVVRHGAPDSPIHISATVRDAMVVIEIADRGPGFPDGTEQLVFEKFYRGSRVRTGGVGLGLSICKAIVEAHGGTIRAENHSNGALFRISLPVLDVPLALEPQASIDLTTAEDDR